MNLRVLLVEDHPCMITLYKQLLNDNDVGYTPDIKVATDCRSAFKLISDPNPLIDFDIAIIDLSIPRDEVNNLNDGEDIAVAVRKYLPHCKTIVITSYATVFKLSAIKNMIRPEGLITKSDFNYPDLIAACTTVLDGYEYKSSTVANALKALFKNGMYLDSYNQKIIMLLSQGVKTKNMPKVLGLSVSAIDKRKIAIKLYFDIEHGGDEEIIAAAKAHNFI